MTKKEYLKKLVESLIDTDNPYYDIQGEHKLLMIAAYKAWEGVKNSFIRLSKNQETIDFFNSLIFRPVYEDSVWIHSDYDMDEQCFDEFFHYIKVIETGSYITRFCFSFIAVNYPISCDVYIPDEFYHDEED